MATALEIALYTGIAFIVLAVLTTIAAIVLFPRKTDDGAEDWETEPHGEASLLGRDEL